MHIAHLFIPYFVSERHIFALLLYQYLLHYCIYNVDPIFSPHHHTAIQPGCGYNTTTTRNSFLLFGRVFSLVPVFSFSIPGFLFFVLSFWIRSKLYSVVSSPLWESSFYRGSECIFCPAVVLSRRPLCCPVSAISSIYSHELYSTHNKFKTL